MNLRIRLSLLLTMALAYEWCSAVPFMKSLHMEDETSNLQRADNTDYRLPGGFNPLSYELSIKPYFTGERAFTFDGTLKLRLQPTETLSLITLHSNGLVIQQNNIKITREEDSIPITGFTIDISDTTHDFLKIQLGAPLDITKVYIIDFETYTGTIRTEMEGFYRSSYKENDVTKWLGTTQFQPVHARKVFPCFDEPSYKATFTLTIIRPESFKASLSNMKMMSSAPPTGGTVTETFYPTPKMSTYLLAFIVSEFEAANKTEATDAEEFGVYARPGASDLGKYAFEVGRKLVTAMDTFTSFKYYNMDVNIKMDQAGLPDFSAGAMENWGLLTYREAYLMYDDIESSVKHRQQIIAVLAHEIAHMWFGDLVTCHWWSDTWLNEGFARYFQYRLPNEVENLEMNVQFIPAQLHTAFIADTSVHSAPLTNTDINTPQQISGHFGSISYNKGASVITMIENLIGTLTFQKALASYLKTKEFSTAQPTDLFLALQAMATSDGSLSSYPGSDVATVMSSWTVQSGYPVLQVTIDYNTGAATLSQTRMVLYGEVAPDTLYRIPLTYTTSQQPDFENSKPKSIMSEKTGSIANVGNGRDWVIFNTKQTGFYRVNYDSVSWGKLATALNGASRETIHRLNRAQIVDDILNLAKENVTDYRTALNVIQFLELESDYAPWSAAIATFSVLRRRFSYAQDTLLRLDAHFLNLIKKAVETLGLTVRDEDSHLIKLFRSNLLNFACLIGHVDCIQNSRELLEGFLSGNQIINANLREHTYCTGLRYGNATHFNYLWSKYLSSNVINDQIAILGALGCSKDAASIETLLEQTILVESRSIRAQDLMTCMNSILNGNEENVEIVFNFIKRNTTAVELAYGTYFKQILTNMIDRMKGTQLLMVHGFLLNSELSADIQSAGVSAITTAGLNKEWTLFHKPTIDSWLDEKYKNGVSAITSSFALISFMFWFLLKSNH